MPVSQLRSVREYVFYVFFRFQKHDFSRFFEMTYQKGVRKNGLSQNSRTLQLQLQLQLMG